MAISCREGWGEPGLRQEQGSPQSTPGAGVGQLLPPGQRPGHTGATSVSRPAPHFLGNSYPTCKAASGGFQAGALQAESRVISSTCTLHTGQQRPWVGPTPASDVIPGPSCGWHKAVKVTLQRRPCRVLKCPWANIHMRKAGDQHAGLESPPTQMWVRWPHRAPAHEGAVLQQPHTRREQKPHLGPHRGRLGRP